MKAAVSIIIFFLATAASAENAKRFVPDKRSPAPDAACNSKVEKLVKATAHAMGVKQEFGIQLDNEPAGQDEDHEPLSKYTTGPFIVDDGYISNSGATVIVRRLPKGCDLVKLNISVDG